MRASAQRHTVGRTGINAHSRRQAMHKRITVHVGLDVHKDSIEIALADGTQGGEVRHYGRIGGDLASLDRAVRQLGGAQRSLVFSYEAGPCGYAIYRHLTAEWHVCHVAAASMTPRRPGERIKTDRRDCIQLARLARAGALTIVREADAHDEADRDFVPAPLVAVLHQREH